MAIQALVRRMPVGEAVVEAILRLVRGAPPGRSARARSPTRIAWGPGPRASQALMLTVRARALLDGRFAPSLDDVASARGAGPAAPHGGHLRGPCRGRRRPRPDRQRGEGNALSRWRTTSGHPRTRAPRRIEAARGLAVAPAGASRRRPPHRRQRACSASMAAARPGRARRSGSSAPMSPASRRGRSTGAARRATTTSMCASANGRRRRPSGSGPICRPRWISARALAADDQARPRRRADAGARRAAGARRRAGRRAGPRRAAHRPRRRRADRARSWRRPRLPADWPSLDRVGRFSERGHAQRLPRRPGDDARAPASGSPGRGALLHLLQIFDPAEETFPYRGPAGIPRSGDRRHLADGARRRRCAAATGSGSTAHREADPQHLRARPASRFARPSHGPPGRRGAALLLQRRLSGSGASALAGHGERSRSAA